MIRFLIISFIVLFISVPVHAERFLSGFDAVPVMDGINEIEQTGMVFDSVDFQIIESIVESDTVSLDAFQKFYIPTLESLGWLHIETKNLVMQFQREGEDLSVEIIRKKKPFIARFLLVPNK